MAEPHESRVYSDLARFYDSFFGRAFVNHELELLESLNFRPGQRVLEVGVGTGISLEAYPPYVHVVGIDASTDMLSHAVEKIKENRWGHIEVMQGDAHNLAYPDNSFDFVCTFHVLTVVPDPIKMMSEMVRVCKPGGTLVVINRFASADPVLYFFNILANPVTKLLGWTMRLRARDVLNGHKIEVLRNEKVSKFSLHTLIMARKQG